MLQEERCKSLLREALTEIYQKTEIAVTLIHAEWADGVKDSGMPTGNILMDAVPVKTLVDIDIWPTRS